MSGIVVTKSSPVLVVPSPDSSPAAGGDTGTVTLSSFDRWVGPIPVTALLVYDRPIHKPAETVKKALARALAYYQPLAGRLATRADGEPCISCTGEGVMLVAATASSALDLEAVATSAALLKDLAVYYPGNVCRDADPLVLFQVTEFSCGGFVLGLTLNHVAADGLGIAQFLQAVGEMARGVLSPSVVPVRRWDASLPGIPTTMVSTQKKATTMPTLDDLAHLNVTVPGSLVRRVKAETGATVDEVVMAVLWRCRTRAVLSASSSSPESPAPLSFLCNMRAHAGAAAGYYGNCFAAQVVMATKSAVAGSSVSDLVTLIKQAKEKAPHVLSGGSVHVNGNSKAAAGGGRSGKPLQPQVGCYDVLSVSSWRNIGFDGVDLGGGAGPARVVRRFAERNVVPGCVVCPPCKDDSRVSVSSMCVKPEHVHAFLGEITNLANSSRGVWIPSRI